MGLRTELAATFLQEAVCVWVLSLVSAEEAKAAVPVKERTESPADVHFIWEKNRHALETCVPVQTHTLPDGRAHALSWLRDAVRETTEYSCSALSSAGNQTSKVQITVMRHEAFQQEKWSQELAAWRAVAGEHDRLMQGWRKAWESCSKDNF